jgi:hypothetical protein
MDFIMTGSSTGKNLSKTSPSRLGTYLATAVGSCGLATSADGAIVNIDLTNVQGNDITAPNGGVASGSKLTIDNWLGAGTGRLVIYNHFDTYNYHGLYGQFDLYFANGRTDASPTNFASGSSIDGSVDWRGGASSQVFEYGSTASADFVGSGFMGFRFGPNGTVNYGWIEATFNPSNSTFQLLSGAYESTPNTAIAAGAAAPVPEPSTGALAALVLGGTALGVARRKRQKAAAATTKPAV